MERGNKMKTKTAIRLTSTHLFIIALGVLMIYPILWMIVSSFKPNNMIFSDAGLIPKAVTIENYISGWVDFMRSRAGDDSIWRHDFQFGDWLDYRGQDARKPAPVTNNELIATAFFAYSCRLLANTAQVLGKTREAKGYADLADKVKAAFNGEFVTPFGRVGPNTQTAYVLALHFDLLPEPVRPLAVERLLEEIRHGQYHLTTGFVGTPYLCHVLSRYGYTDAAYKLLEQESYPSWL